MDSMLHEKLRRAANDAEDAGSYHCRVELQYGWILLETDKARALADEIERCYEPHAEIEPDSQERIDADAMKFFSEYWKCADIRCEKCPAIYDGKTPYERYETDSDCKSAMVLDLLRRQRDLDKNPR